MTDGRLDAATSLLRTLHERQATAEIVVPRFGSLPDRVRENLAHAIQCLGFRGTRDQGRLTVWLWLGSPNVAEPPTPPSPWPPIRDDRAAFEAAFAAAVAKDERMSAEKAEQAKRHPEAALQLLRGRLHAAAAEIGLRSPAGEPAGVRPIVEPDTDDDGASDPVLVVKADGDEIWRCKVAEISEIPDGDGRYPARFDFWAELACTAGDETEAARHALATVAAWAVKRGYRPS